MRPFSPTVQAAPRAAVMLRDRVGPLGLVGVLGGMGPLATIDFMQKVMAATKGTCDQEHVPLIVSSIPQIPDRTAAYRGSGPSPLPALLACGERLVLAGAGLIVMPCNTAHLWFDGLQQALGVPMIHMVEAALQDALHGTLQGMLRHRDNPFTAITQAPATDATSTAPAPAKPQPPSPRFGLLATGATLESGLYVQLRHAQSMSVATVYAPANSSANAALAIDWLLPSDAQIAHWVSPGIAAIKAGDLSTGEALLQLAAQDLALRGAQRIVLGCTEIPLVLHSGNAPVPVIDATTSLAQRAVAWSLAQTRFRGA